MEKIHFSVEGMVCQACADRLRRGLELGVTKELKKGSPDLEAGIVRADINLILRRGSLEAPEVSWEKLRSIADKLGFTLSRSTAAKQGRSKGTVLRTAILLALFAFAVFEHRRHGGHAGHGEDPWRIWAHTLLAAIAYALGAPYLVGAWKVLRSRSIDRNVLMALSSSVAMVLSIYSIVRGPYVSPLEPVAAIFGFAALGRLIEESVLGKMFSQDASLPIVPTKVRVLRGNEESTIDVNLLSLNDRLPLRAGETVAVDGRVETGELFLDERALSGESLSQSKKAGDHVPAGAFVEFGEAVIIAETTPANSSLQGLLDSTQTLGESHLAKITDALSRWFLLTTAAIAVLAWGVWSALGNPSRGTEAFLAVLVVGCPCALGLVLPLVTSSVWMLGARHGVVVRNAEALERLLDVGHLVFDKTGTLTGTNIRVRSIVWRSGGPEPGTDLPASDPRLMDLKGIASESEHPLSLAIVKGLADVPAVPPFSSVRVEHGFGVIAEKSDGTFLLLGNEVWIRQNAVPVEGARTYFVHAKRHGHSAEVISLCEIGFENPVREEAPDVVSQLQARGLELVLLSGDRTDEVEAVGRALGIKRVFGRATPDAKLKTIGSLKNSPSGPRSAVAMVGDGLNDLAALRAADVSIVMGGGVVMGVTSAFDIVLERDALEKLPFVFDLAKRARLWIRINLAWAFVFNAALLPIAAGVLDPLGLRISPSSAAMAMMFSSLTLLSMTYAATRSAK